MKKSDCERCRHNFVSKYDGDDVCLVCLTELEEDELYETYLLSCSVNGRMDVNLYVVSDEGDDAREHPLPSEFNDTRLPTVMITTCMAVKASK